MSRLLKPFAKTHWHELLFQNIPGNVTLGPEDCIQRGVYLLMSELAFHGKYRGIFFHPPNEAYVGRGKLARLRIALMRSLGLLPGIPDWVFLWDGGGGLIELKVKSRKLKENQLLVQQWCHEMNVRHAVALSVEEVRQTLIQWRAIDGP